MILITNQDSSFKITQGYEIEKVKRHIKPGDIVTYYDDFRSPAYLEDVKNFYIFQVESISVENQQIIPVQDSIYIWRVSGDKLRRKTFIDGYHCLSLEHLISKNTVLRKANMSELLHYHYGYYGWIFVKKGRSVSKE